MLLLIAGILASSCVFDADKCVMPSDEPRSVMFTVALENQKTKASWEENQDEVGEPDPSAIPFDYRIAPEQLRVVVYALDGTRIGTIQNLDYWPINDNQTRFQFIGQMPEGFADHFNENSGLTSYKFMVLANCGENHSGEQYITYSHIQLDPTSADASIPMWGVKESDLSPLLDDDSVDLGEIWLLRAAAKIEVRLSEALKNNGSRIESATLKYYNQTGYCLPSGWSEVSDTWSLDQENCMRLYRHAAVNLPFIMDEDGGSCHVYVTEYDNQNYPGERNKISLELNVKGEVKTFNDAISFCRYIGGLAETETDYDIVRNHIYDFEITKIAGDNLSLEYTVADWDAEDWGTGKDYEEHDLSYPTYHNPVVPKDYFSLSSADAAEYVIAEQPQMSYNANDLEAGAFECFFQITAPANVLWKPAITGTRENYRVRVYNHTDDPEYRAPLFDSSDNNLQRDLGPNLGNEWYRIAVFPLSSEGAGSNEIDFSISYYQSWTDQYIHLYINGEYDHIRWPQSGDNPKIIKIEHVSER